MIYLIPSVLSLNARSIVNKLDLFHATVIEMKPDIVGVTETWATDSILDSELDLEGYQKFRCDRQTGNRGGGVLIYVKDIILNPTEYQTKSLYGEHVWCQVGWYIIDWSLLQVHQHCSGRSR